MKHPRLIAGVAILAAIGIGVVVVQFFQERPAEAAAALRSPSPEALPPVNPLPAAASSKPAPAPARQAPVAPAAVREFVPTVTVGAGDVLARVNGTAIQLKDLVPLEPKDTAQAMTVEEHQSRLNRAIDVELTFQAARAGGVGLTTDQRQRLARIEQTHKARLTEYQLQGISWSSGTRAQWEFEQRLKSALLLQQNLVAKEAAVAPSPDPALQARYEEALAGMLGRLKAVAGIGVSPTGAPAAGAMIKSGSGAPSAAAASSAIAGRQFARL